MASAVKEAQAQRSWDAGGAQLRAVDGFARRAALDRKYDWNALKFPAPTTTRSTGRARCLARHRRHRVAADSNAIPAEHFTFSTMILPVAPKPLHVHNDVEEIFFVLRGK